MAILDDFDEVTALWRGHPFGPLVIEDQQIGFGALAEDAGEAPVVMGEVKVEKQPREPSF